MRTQNAFERERAEGGALPADIKRYKAGKRRPVKSERVSQSRPGPPFFCGKFVIRSAKHRIGAKNFI